MKRKANTMPVKEADISKLIKDQLEIYYRQGKLRYFRAHPVRPVTRKGKTFFVPVEKSQKGAPDYFVFLPTETWLVETKKPGKELSPEQVTWQAWAFDKPAIWYRKIDTVREAYALLDVLKIRVRGLI